MNELTDAFSRWEGVARPVGVAALVVAGCLVWRDPESLAPAWRCAVFVGVGPALGCLLFALIHQLTGGEWGQALRPFLVAGARLLPWCWGLMLPLLIVAWRADQGGGGWRYTSPAALASRTVAALLIFWFFSAALSRAWPRRLEKRSLGWVGPAGLISLFFLTHLLVSDWLAALDRHWHSTAFPVVWLVGQAVAGLALSVLGALAAGADPARKLDYHRRLGIDWGTLLFAAAMLWCYLAFAQFLIVWSGNLPEETQWFSRRLAGGWRVLPLILVLVHFIAPLVVLLSRRAKQSRRALAVVAVLLLLGQTIHTAWIILPAFPKAPTSTPWAAAVLSVAFGAFFIVGYVRTSNGERRA